MPGTRATSHIHKDKSVSSKPPGHVIGESYPTGVWLRSEVLRLKEERSKESSADIVDWYGHEYSVDYERIRCCMPYFANQEERNIQDQVDMERVKQGLTPNTMHGLDGKEIEELWFLNDMPDVSKLKQAHYSPLPTPLTRSLQNEDMSMLPLSLESDDEDTPDLLDKATAAMAMNSDTEEEDEDHDYISEDEDDEEDGLPAMATLHSTQLGPTKVVLNPPIITLDSNSNDITVMPSITLDSNSNMNVVPITLDSNSNITKEEEMICTVTSPTATTTTVLEQDDGKENHFVVSHHPNNQPSLPPKGILFLGGFKTTGAQFLLKHKVTKVILCARVKDVMKATHSKQWLQDMEKLEARNLVKFTKLELCDTPKQKLHHHVLVKTLLEVHSALKHGQNVSIVCRKGMSRSGSFVIAWTMARKGLSLREAFEYIKQIRPVVNPNKGFMRQLLEFQNSISMTYLRERIGLDNVPERVAYLKKKRQEQKEQK